VVWLSNERDAIVCLGDCVSAAPCVCDGVLWLQWCGQTICGCWTICHRLTAGVILTLQSAPAGHLIDSTVLLASIGHVHFHRPSIVLHITAKLQAFQVHQKHITQVFNWIISPCSPQVRWLGSLRVCTLDLSISRLHLVFLAVSLQIRNLDKLFTQMSLSPSTVSWY